MNRKLYWGLAALILFISAFGFLLYRQHVDIQQLKKEAAEAEKQLEEKNMPIVENNERPARPGYKLVPHGDHFHEVPVSAPDTWQGEPHEPVVTDEDVTPEVVDKPDWIYDPDREQPDGWDPKLVFESGDTKIDLNHFRSMTEEEQAEYERLKATVNLEAYGDNVEAEMRFVAIVYTQTKLWQQVRSAYGTPEVDKLRAEYDKLYGRFPVSD